MARLGEIVEFLNSKLDISGFRDASVNGLQVQAHELSMPILRVAVAVDSGLSVFEEAIRKKAQLLIVHHGLFWGECKPLVGILAEKVSCLLKGGCSLYASHLPLDAHPVLGNAACIARELELIECMPFGEYNGRPIGVKGRLPSVQGISHFMDYARGIYGKEPLLLEFGKKEISTVAIVTGSGSSAIPRAAATGKLGSLSEVPDGIDLYFTGEPKQDAYHTAKEFGMNCIFAGHYATETFGVRAVGKLLEEKFACVCEFIDQPTGI